MSLGGESKVENHLAAGQHSQPPGWLNPLLQELADSEDLIDSRLHKILTDKFDLEKQSID